MAKKLINIFFVLLLTYVSTASAGLTDLFKYKKSDGASLIKVLLLENVDGALVEVKGRGYKIYDPHTNNRLGTRFFGKRYYVQALKNGLKWGEFFPKTYQIMIEPDEPSTTLLVDGKEYKGSLYIYQVGDKVHVINELSLDEYVSSVLGTKINQAYAPEALAATAITERTEAFYRAWKNKDSYWHVRASEVGYQGYAATHRPYGVDEAVKKTKNMIMQFNSYGNMQPFAAKWTPNSAGRTASLRAIYHDNSPVPFAAKETPYAAMSKETSAWNFEISKDDFARYVNLPYVTGAEAYQDPESGKVYALRVFNDKHSLDVEVGDLLKKLEPKGMLSNNFNLKQEGNFLVFSGYGRGLGVGMCLYSADIMAKQGMNAKAILDSFFSEVNLAMLRDASVNDSVAGQEQVQSARNS